MEYLSGFNNHHETEAKKDALPKSRNSPQNPAFGLYAEQLSGTAFTLPRDKNQRSWLYRVRPSVAMHSYKSTSFPNFLSQVEPCKSPEPYRWDPVESENSDFLSSIKTMCLNGSPLINSGNAVHVYNGLAPQKEMAFYNHDGDFLIVPQCGNLKITTELGLLEIEPGEIVVIPRGIGMHVETDRKSSSVFGYISENYGSHFELPPRGVIGANCLANERDFLYPKANYVDSDQEYDVIIKNQGEFFKAKRRGNPFDVVAWHGNYAPYKYDLRKFNTVGSISYDHPDPSIFTVLTSQTSQPGLANIDFVIFPPRWMVAEDTFRPPWYHKNVMSEFMGLIYGDYDAKPGDGFKPGGASLHNCMTPHGPDKQAFDHASGNDLTPHKLDNTMAFMFESCLFYEPSSFAVKNKQPDYGKCWDGLDKRK